MRNEYRIALQKEQEERRQRQELLESQQQYLEQQQQQWQERDKIITDSRLQKKYNMNNNSERTEYHKEVNRLDQQREFQYQYRQY